MIIDDNFTHIAEAKTNKIKNMVFVEIFNRNIAIKAV